jgi:hypothetical protein
MPRSFRISVETGDAFACDADVLVLKYAQNLYGVDKAAYGLLTKAGVKLQLPIEGAFALTDTRRSMRPKSALFVGVVTLQNFSYLQIRDFARHALEFLADTGCNAQSVALTVHGPGYGLDELEAFRSEFAGVVDAATNGNVPEALNSVVFIEADPRRATRLQRSLTQLCPRGVVVVDDGGALETKAQTALRTVGYASSSKSHVFVAMPFAPEMDDVFHYGIQGAVNAAGLLCERADLSSFTGDVVNWVKTRISSASLVIADLSSANPNVYLEVGYAWGREVPTVLLARDEHELKFDTKGHRCILYRSIKNLEDLLSKELRTLPDRH